MKVKVRLARWSTGPTVNSAAARKLADEVLPEPDPWQHPPRYELKPAARSRFPENVIAIRQDSAPTMAEVRPIRQEQDRNRTVDQLTPEELVQGITHVLNPASAFLLALGLWRLGSDLGLTSAFVVSEGILSHWQVWIAAAGALQALGSTLRRKFADYRDQTRAAD